MTQQTTARERIETLDRVGGELRIGDDDVAARHHRIVAELQRRAAAVGAVIGGDERPSGLAAGAERDPGRRARAGVDEVDPFLGDQPREARHVERHRQRVLGRRGKRREHAADRLQLAGQPSALATRPARARPPRTRAAATSMVVRSAPPASRRGMICRIVRPASEARSARPKGASVATLTRAAAPERRAPRASALTAAAASAMPAPPA